MVVIFGPNMTEQLWPPDSRMCPDLKAGRLQGGVHLANANGSQQAV